MDSAECLLTLTAHSIFVRRSSQASINEVRTVYLIATQHILSINGKRDSFSRKDLLSVANQLSNFDLEANEIISDIRQVILSWRQYAAEAGVFDSFTDKIESNHRTDI